MRGLLATSEEITITAVTKLVAVGVEKSELGFCFGSQDCGKKESQG